ncbi:MAG: acyl carrier protein [Planctomycetaceae bacterium]|nr:acyl carrier protein [Planctomycetaceae bacterium]
MTPDASPSRESRSAEEIQRWLTLKLCEQAQLEPSEIRGDEPLVAHGVGSMQFVVIVGELEDWLGCRFVGNPITRYPTINSLSAFLARETEQGKTVIDPSID